jgi:hypothetical protein
MEDRRPRLSFLPGAADFSTVLDNFAKVLEIY